MLNKYKNILFWGYCLTREPPPKNFCVDISSFTKLNSMYLLGTIGCLLRVKMEALLICFPEILHFAQNILKVTNFYVKGRKIALFYILKMFFF